MVAYNLAASKGQAVGSLGSEFFVNLPRKQLSPLSGLPVSMALTQAYNDQPRQVTSSTGTTWSAGKLTWADLYAIDYIAGGGATATFETCELAVSNLGKSVGTPKLGSGELVLVGLVPLALAVYRRRTGRGRVQRRGRVSGR